MSNIITTEEDEKIHWRGIATDITRYVLAIIQQQDLRNKLNKMSKQAIIDYANRRGIDIYVSRMRQMSKFQLIENCLEAFVNRIDYAESLISHDIDTDEIDQLVNLYLHTREEK